MNTMHRYVTQFTVMNMPADKTHYRYAFDLLVLSSMTAIEIMREIDSRCRFYVKEISGYLPPSEHVSYQFIGSLNAVQITLTNPV